MVAAIFDFQAIKKRTDVIAGRAFSGRMWVRNPDGTQSLFVGAHDFIEEWRARSGEIDHAWGRCRRCACSREDIADRIAPEQCTGIMPKPGEVIWENRHMAIVHLAIGVRYCVDQGDAERCWRAIKRYLSTGAW